MSRKQLDIGETRIRVYTRDFFHCQYPGCNISGYMNLQMAHNVSKGKGNTSYVIGFWLREFGKDITINEAEKILNHDMNLTTSCPNHNSYFNIGNNPVERDKLLKKIENSKNSCWQNSKQ